MPGPRPNEDSRKIKIGKGLLTLLSDDPGRELDIEETIEKLREKDPTLDPETFRSEVHQNFRSAFEMDRKTIKLAGDYEYEDLEEEVKFLEQNSRQKESARLRGKER